MGKIFEETFYQRAYTNITNKHMKRCIISLVKGKCQLKPLEWLYFKK